MTRAGVFISFEGTEGSGKSTQMKLLATQLRNEGRTVVENIEPGGTDIGKQIRRVLLDSRNQEMAPMAELLLMFASRAQAVQQTIRPALDRGEIVLSDRFTDSSLAYQGEARGLGFELVRELHRLAIGDLMPGLTICVDIDLKTGLARAHRRNNQLSGDAPNETRLDAQSLDFHRRVRQGYRKIAALEPQRFRLVSGEGSPDVIAARIRAEVDFLLPSATPAVR